MTLWRGRYYIGWALVLFQFCLLAFILVRWYAGFDWIGISGPMTEIKNYIETSAVCVSLAEKTIYAVMQDAIILQSIVILVTILAVMRLTRSRDPVAK